MKKIHVLSFFNSMRGFDVFDEPLLIFLHVINGKDL